MATRLSLLFGKNRLVEANSAIVHSVWKEIAELLWARFRPADYQQKDKINEILHAALEFVEEKLDRLIKRLASREIMELVLYQYDIGTALLEQRLDTGELGHESSLALKRRALKYLAEQIMMRSLSNSFSPVHFSNLTRKVEEAVLRAEIMVQLYQMSHLTSYVLPDHVLFSLLSTCEPAPIRFLLVHPFESLMSDHILRRRNERRSRKKWFPQMTIDYDPAAQSQILDNSFRECFGLPYLQFIETLKYVIHYAIPAGGTYPITFNHREKLIKEVGSNLDLDVNIVQRVLAGFTLQKTVMSREVKKNWDPKRTHRALRRGFFEMPHRLGLHLTWSRAMAHESLNLLINGVCFKKLPDEWSTSETKNALDRLSKTASDWFERRVAECLWELGIQGSRRKGQVRGNDASISIPKEVGEIDFLGFSNHEKLIVVAECKMVEDWSEPKFWRDDLSDFVGAKKSYQEKFQKKVQWVVENRIEMSRLLSQGPGDCGLAAVMLTLYPIFIGPIMKGFRCVSLAELLADFEEAKKWPYEIL